MDLPVIGSHCSLPSCNELDFLPIRCHCAKLFCKNHISPDAHDCSSLAEFEREPGKFEKQQRCALEQCNKPSLESFLTDSSTIEGRSPAICARCSKSYCVSHRYPESHACPVDVSPPPLKNEAARALLAKHFPSPSGSQAASTAQRPAKTPTDPKKLEMQQRIQMMKVRQHAKPADPKDKPTSVSPDQRLHVRIATNEVVGTESIFWFRKNIGTGKALDLMAARLKVAYSDTNPIQLRRITGHSDGKALLRNDQELAAQITEGSTLLITRP